MSIMPRLATYFFSTLFAITISFYVTASTLEDVLDREELICGVRGGSFGFGKVDDNGKWSGLDVDFCRAIAAAALKDQNKVDFVPVTNGVRFVALQNYDVDVLIRNTTWTYTRDAGLGIEFVGVNFYDGQGFMGWKDAGKTKLREYDSSAKICMIRNTTSLINLKDHLKNNNLTYNIIEHDSTDAADNNFLKRKCDLYSTDRSILVSFQQSNLDFSSKLTILDDIISKEPLGPSVRDDDTQWKDIVQWVFFATIEAEEKGVTSGNVDTLRQQSKDPSLRYLLGVDPGVGKPLGLDDEWVYRLIKFVGNYGEIFERNMGKGSDLGLERGLNDLWTRGGLMYSPPMR